MSPRALSPQPLCRRTACLCIASSGHLTPRDCRNPALPEPGGFLRRHSQWSQARAQSTFPRDCSAPLDWPAPPELSASPRTPGEHTSSKNWRAIPGNPYLRKCPKCANRASRGSPAGDMAVSHGDESPMLPSSHPGTCLARIAPTRVWLPQWLRDRAERGRRQIN
jgi:hypothetical protein